MQSEVASAAEVVPVIKFRSALWLTKWKENIPGSGTELLENIQKNNHNGVKPVLNIEQNLWFSSILT